MFWLCLGKPEKLRIGSLNENVRVELMYDMKDEHSLKFLALWSLRSD